MSMSYWSTDGYGVRVSDVENLITLESVKALLHRAPKFEAEVQEWLDDIVCEDHPQVTLNDYEDFDQDYYTKFAYLLKCVIEEAEGLPGLITCTDEECNTYLMFEPAYPWSYVGTDWKTLTKEKVFNVIDEYLEILAPGNTTIPDYITAYNYG